MTMQNRGLEQLYPLVSLAIHQAEVAKAKGLSSLAAAINLDVSLLEEEIAELLPADDEEGAIARRGVLTAALAAQQYPRVVEMADKYLAEAVVDDALRARLAELRGVARREVDALQGLPDVFDPGAEFHLAA